MQRRSLGPLKNAGLRDDAISAGKVRRAPTLFVQTKRWVPDRMSIRLPVIYAHVHAYLVQYPQKLDGPSQRALIFLPPTSLREYHCVSQHTNVKAKS